MSNIRGIWQGAPPPFPPVDQHPDARRFGPITLADGSVVFVDALGSQPTTAEIEVLLPKPAPLAAAAKLDQHLKSAIAELSATPKGKTAMRGMQRLADLTPRLMKAIDDRADAVADRLVKGQARAEEAIGKFDALASSIENTADDIEAALGQISNDPTQASGGSGA